MYKIYIKHTRRGRSGLYSVVFYSLSDVAKYIANPVNSDRIRKITGVSRKMHRILTNKYVALTDKKNKYAEREGENG